ncbi:MAG TPA: bifunctional DNA primase/polymerase [Actinophytocola sp.]|uniref:bifunctional DNA primase/polymerase n=1 Tax=Actinophytocola sp. TaxID=1872138 RepID=UPI002DBB8DDD|nr:bifunctional DNA primase/polymerase [Actinophytocola sp.]HEU5474313.1 bifunctional DNA primase/polymerase [Actinophytocola sp.]
MDWSDSWLRAFRVELRAQVIGLAWRRWPVLPGTYPAGGHWAGRTDAPDSGPVPVHDDWQERIGSTPEEVAGWWTGRPYNLLLATGGTLDAVEMGSGLGTGVARVLRSIGLPVPIIGTPNGRWLFLVQASARLADGLAGHADVVVHGAGSWVPLPPSQFPHGVAHWRVRPEVCGWHIPEAHIVQDAVLDAVAGVPAGHLVTTADRS